MNSKLLSSRSLARILEVLLYLLTQIRGIGPDIYLYLSGFSLPDRDWIDLALHIVQRWRLNMLDSSSLGKSNVEDVYGED